MVDLPLPIGVDRMLVDIAEGLGEAARKLPELSRSDVGAVAMKRASVEVNFELSSRSATAKDGFGLGAQTFRFTSDAQRTEATALNTGRITLEIVAIIESDEPPPENAGTTQTGREPRPAIGPAPGRPANATPVGSTPAAADTPEPQAPDAATLRQAVNDLRSRIAASGLSEDQKRTLDARLDKVLAALAAGNIEAALTEMRAVLAAAQGG